VIAMHDDFDLTAPETASRDATLESPQTVGSYRLLEKLGEGGMGQVWLAEQTYPLRRRVALKLVRGGMDTKEAVARFESERQALAMMDHPVIAKVFDAGSTAAGQPYFAMEYVPGVRITEYCDTHHLTTRQRLELFIQVCDGVQHAHQKAVIHRDLKPSNVLVSAQDGRPTPKIIDFGVAKAIGQPLTEKTLYTQLGAMIGTPEYMSPEQAGLTSQDVDTRTDVYSLGAILYELLAGALPFDSQELRKNGYEGLRKKLLEEEPPRPSTRVRTTRQASAGTAKGRTVEPIGLERQLKGDLDWITMKALEKDRERRYSSPSDFAADIRRYLRNEPVVARPPSAAYRAAKFVRRHRIGVTVAGMTALLLVAVSVTAILQARRISRERDRANQEARVSQRVSDFLIDLFRVPDPGEARGNSVTARELLDGGARQVETALEDEPKVQARLTETIGRTYDSLGLYAEAQRQLERALALQQRTFGSESPEAAAYMAALASEYVRRNQYPAAEKLFQKAFDIQRRTLRGDHPDLLATMQDLGWVIAQRGQYVDGEKLVREALEAERRTLGREHATTLLGMNRLGNVFIWEGRYAEQEAIIREELEIRRRTQGPDHPLSLAAERMLAGAISDQGRLEEAERLHREVLESTRRVLGPDHPRTAAAMNDLANTLLRGKRFPEAERLFLEAVDITRRALGPEADSTLLSMNNLALVYFEDHRNREAEQMFSELLNISRRVRGPTHQRTLMVMNNLGLAYAHERRYGEATNMLRETVERARTSLGENHPFTATTILSLAEVAALQGHREEALDLLRQAVDHGYRDSDQIASDEDLKSLRGDPRFEAILAETRKLAVHKR
jgi:serine/threonine protein kinase/tetratricopeptide (TPR) repeat protein